MDGAGGRGARARRGSRSAAARGRGAEKGAARSPSRGRVAGEGSSGAATLRPPRTDAPPARGCRPARRAPAAQELPAGGAEALPAPRSRAPAARAPAAPRSVAAVPDAAVAAPARRPPPAADSLRLREVLSRLSLARDDVSAAATRVNQVVSHLVQAIRSQDGCFSSIERESSGSYYERVKISEPDEFDIMLVMPVPRIQLDESDDTGAFYYVSFKRNPKEKCLLKFVDEDRKLSAFKMLEALRKIIKQEVKNIKDQEVIVARRKAGCPAITLQIKNPPSEISVDIILTLEVKQSWPLSTQDGLKIGKWLGTKARRDFRLEPLYLVAKQNKREKVLKGTSNMDNRNTWRISFSHIEKKMINNHGRLKTCCESDGPKCCRKGCLKLMKYLLEQLKMKYPKELKIFCSYHVKTAFLHCCATWPNDSDWHLGELEDCFEKCLVYFQNCLKDSQLPHFFIPQYNLLSLEDKARHNFLSSQISRQKDKKFPVFHENY